MDKKIIILASVIFLVLINLINAGVVIVSPVNNSEVINSLSFVINVTNSGGFNSSINYTWNNGIRNYSLCTNCNSASSNSTTISVPRTGYYNISIYAFNSSGSMQSNISVIFIGNKTITSVRAETSESTFGQSIQTLIDSNDMTHIYYSDYYSNSSNFNNFLMFLKPTIASPEPYGSILLNASNSPFVSRTNQDTNLYNCSTNTTGNFSCSINSISTSLTNIFSTWDTNYKQHSVFRDESLNDLIYINNTNGSWTQKTLYTTAGTGKCEIALDYNNNIHTIMDSDTLDDIVYCNLTGCTVLSADSFTGTSSASLDVGFNNIPYVIYINSSNKMRICNLTSGSWLCSEIPIGTMVRTTDKISLVVDNNIHILYTNDSKLWYYNNIGGNNIYQISSSYDATYPSWTKPIAIKKGAWWNNQTSKNIHITFQNTTGIYLYERQIYFTNNYPNVTNVNPSNNSNSSSNSSTFLFNVTDDNDYINSFSIYLDNNLNITVNSLTYINVTSGANNLMGITISNLSEGVHSWFAKVCDSDNLCSNSSYTNFTIDSIAPIISGFIPPNNSQFSNKTNMSINFTRTDSSGISSCWWYNSSLVNNTLTINQNITVSESADGNYNLTINCNDTLNNVATYIYFYTVSESSPAITKWIPLDSIYYNFKNTFFNYTATDSNGLSVCRLYGDFNGSYSINYTWNNPNSGVMNYTNLSLNDGVYKYKIWCNDTTNVIQLGNNFTFTVDTTYPIIQNITTSTTVGSKAFTFSANITDTNLNTCKYTIYNSLNYPDGTTNKSMVCSSNIADLISNFGSYTLQIYAIDLAGNENSTNHSFTISDSGGDIGGGGGSTIIENNTLPNFCGNGICNQKFMYQGLLVDKNRYNCPSDCAPFDFDEFFYSLTIYCVPKLFNLPPEKIDKCFWINLFKRNFTSSTFSITEESINNTCGDNKCTSFEMITCNKDCDGGFNTNTLYNNCVNNNPGTCFYKLNMFFYSIIGIFILILILSFVPVKYENRKIKGYQYVQLNYRKRRKRWKRR